MKDIFIRLKEAKPAYRQRQASIFEVPRQSLGTTGTTGYFIFNS